MALSRRKFRQPALSNEGRRHTDTMSGTWELPTAGEVLEVAMPDGALVYVRRHGNPSGPRILLSHGCGLAVDAYYPFWSMLLARFDLFAYDLRSHGWNPPGPHRSQNIPTFVQDCEHILRAIGQGYDERPVIGVFHSLSALVALLHEEQWKGFSSLVLFDPPVRPPGGKPEDLAEIGEEMSAAARRRRERFETRGEFAERLRRSRNHRRLLPGVAELMAETTLRPAQEGPGYELCCPREYEAQVYEYLFGWAMRVDLRKISCPVKAIGTDPTEPYSFMPSMDLRQLIELDYDFLPETTHFLQMEKPEECAELTVKFLKGLEVI